MGTGPLPESCCDDELATVWLWSGHAAYCGPSLQLAAHSGSVHCFALGLDAAFLLRSEATGERRVRSALIPARMSHQIVADGRMLFFYIDPGESLGNLADQMTDRSSAIACRHRDEAELISTWLADPEPDPETLWLRLRGPVMVGAMDERIRTAIRLLQSQPNDSAHKIAAAVNLSPSRFLHLFSEHAGTSFRRYRLWAKMRHAAQAISLGADLTEASAAAGFASPSHFSDTFRTMFGLSATDLFSRPTRLVVAETPTLNPSIES